MAVENSKGEAEPVYVAKQRTLVFGNRGIASRFRHLMQDIRDILPHAKKEAKLDNSVLKKKKNNSAPGFPFINTICEMKSCNNCLFFECRKKRDLYLWASRSPTGPSAKFLVHNIHTYDELKLTGNCLKYSRPLLHFDASFRSEPHLSVLQELFTQMFAAPNKHPKTKPFIDHVISFFYCDEKIWFRHYQVVQDNMKKDGANTLVEIGPRFVMEIVKVFEGSFEGKTMYENPKYVSPSKLRSLSKRKKGQNYKHRLADKEKSKKYHDKIQLPAEYYEVENVFHEK